MKNLSIFVLLCIILDTSYSAFCKFLLKDYFNLETINYVSIPHKLDQNNQIYPTLCHDYASPHFCQEPGNLFLLKKSAQQMKCKSLSNSRDGSGRRYSWDRIRIPGVELWDDPDKFEELIKKYSDQYILDKKSKQKNRNQLFNKNSKKSRKIETILSIERKLEKLNESENMPNQGSMVFNTTISLTTEIIDEETKKFGIKTASYILICPETFKTRQSQYKTHLTKDNNLLFLYRGNKSCGYNVIEASVFIKRHKTFALIIILSALFTLLTLVPLQQYPILWKLNHPNLPISGSTFSLGILTAISFLSNFEHYLPMSYSDNLNALTVFYICVIFQSFLLAFMSFYSPMSVAPLHSVSIGLVLSYISSTLYLLISGNGVSQDNFHIMIVTLSLFSVGTLSLLGMGKGNKLIGKRRNILKNGVRLSTKPKELKETGQPDLKNLDDLGIQDSETSSSENSNSYAKSNSKYTKKILKRGETMKNRQKKIKRALINKKSSYTLGPLIVGFCTPFYLFYGIGCYFSWWPEIITREIEQSYGISVGGERGDWWAWWGLLGIMSFQVIGIFSGLDLLE